MTDTIRVSAHITNSRKNFLACKDTVTQLEIKAVQGLLDFIRPEGGSIVGVGHDESGNIRFFNVHHADGSLEEDA